MIRVSRRSFLTGLAVGLAAPAIARLPFDALPRGLIVPAWDGTEICAGVLRTLFGKCDLAREVFVHWGPWQLHDVTKPLTGLFFKVRNDKSDKSEETWIYGELPRILHNNFEPADRLSILPTLPI